MNIQTEIKPILEQFVVLERAVIYARVSGDDRGKEGRNLAGQLDMGQKHCQQKSYRIVAELAEDDRGVSGANIDLPQLNCVREMAHAGEFDVLVVRELDRLSRNLAKQLIIEEELARAGVRIEYVLSDYEDTPEGRLQKHIRATVAEYEREKIKERMTRGRRLSVKSGNIIVFGRPPYGYRVVNDEHNKRTLEIVEDEARIIKLIFEWYLSGWSMDKISRELSAQTIPTHFDTGTRQNCRKKKRGYGQWSKATVGDILNNEVYTGIWRFGKRSRAGKKWIDNPVETTIPVQIPPIIDVSTWQAVQEKRAKNKASMRRKSKYEYLLARKCRCGFCAYKLHAVGGSRPYRYYRCIGNSDPERHKCDLPLFPVKAVDTVVWEWIKSIFRDPVALKLALDDYNNEQATGGENLKRQIESADLSIQKHTNELNGYLADLDELRDRNTPKAKEAIYARIERVEKTLADLEVEKNKLVLALEAKLLTPEKRKSIEDYAEEVRADLGEIEIKDDFPGKRRIIEILNTEVTLTVENGVKIVYVRCYLGKKSLFLSSIDTNLILC